MAKLSISQSDSSQRASDSLGGAGEKVKSGFGKFMSGLDSWANKTADKMAAAAERVGIKD